MDSKLNRLNIALIAVLAIAAVTVQADNSNTAVGQTTIAALVP